MFGVRSPSYLLPGLIGSFNLKWKTDVSVRGPILAVTPTSAEPLLWASVWTAGEMPALTRNRIGNGAAYAAATTESALVEDPELLRYLWMETIGDPLWKVGINPQRYLVRIRRQKQCYVLHVIDSLTTNEGPMSEAYSTPRYRPLYTKISLNSERIPFEKATVMPDNRALKISTEGIWKTLEIYPDPELTIVLE